MPQVPPHDSFALRSRRVQELTATVHQRILDHQKRNAELQTRRIRAKLKGGRRPLQVGDLAFLLTPSDGFKTQVKGPFLVVKKTENQVVLQTTAAIEGQQSHSFSVHVNRVARCTTVTDVLEDLLKQSSPAKDPPADAQS